MINGCKDCDLLSEPPFVQAAAQGTPTFHEQGSSGLQFSHARWQPTHKVASSNKRCLRPIKCSAGSSTGHPNFPPAGQQRPARQSRTQNVPTSSRTASRQQSAAAQRQPAGESFVSTVQQGCDAALRRERFQQQSAVQTTCTNAAACASCANQHCQQAAERGSPKAASRWVTGLVCALVA